MSTEILEFRDDLEGVVVDINDLSETLECPASEHELCSDLASWVSTLETQIAKLNTWGNGTPPSDPCAEMRSIRDAVTNVRNAIDTKHTQLGCKAAPPSGHEACADLLEWITALTTTINGMNAWIAANCTEGGPG